MSTTAPKHGDLGKALRSWRDRVDPAEVGVPHGGVRRAAGLRREELAQLAQVSVDYLIRLEQGRATSPSPQVLEALARALRLSGQERAHLFRLAGHTPPGPDRIPRYISPSLQRLLAQLDGTPLSVHDAAGNLVTCNALWTALFGDQSARKGRDANVYWRHFTGDAGRVSHTDEQRERFEVNGVGDLRASSARYPDDPDLRSLIDDLYERSPRFAELWDSHVLAEHVDDTKTIHHPAVGAITMDCDVLTVPGSDLHIIAYTTKPGSEAAGKLRLLAAIGVQDLTTADHLPDG